ncbi:hypothetical protein BpHYR1_022185 [Brachionus plicatilis]|uniref:Uncharacterized protein n=1 Tax=Brachionus plicatilis TaxID=10195 RepID=A0A3M7PF98_BRAPC|nr:hypothetical protein BpHYR1_022185 [Brachionus plicatilis]
MINSEFLIYDSFIKRFITKKRRHQNMSLNLSLKLLTCSPFFKLILINQIPVQKKYFFDIKKYLFPNISDLNKVNLLKSKPLVSKNLDL